MSNCKSPKKCFFFFIRFLVSKLPNKYISTNCIKKVAIKNLEFSKCVLFVVCFSNKSHLEYHFTRVIVSSGSLFEFQQERIVYVLVVVGIALFLVQMFLPRLHVILVHDHALKIGPREIDKLVKRVLTIGCKY